MLSLELPVIDDFVSSIIPCASRLNEDRLVSRLLGLFGSLSLRLELELLLFFFFTASEESAFSGFSSGGILSISAGVNLCVVTRLCNG